MPLLKDVGKDMTICVRLVPRFGNACYYHDFDSIVYQLFIYKQYTITGIENIHIIQKRQITGANNNFFTFENFVMLMAIMSKI
ncbi:MULTISPECIES: hypothetical protein [unclassified Candidatus Tisiphia]|uniref:Uncharacterized protein n=1 Tax=Candidatus Tisiphia endosymbiont of Sergentomyia squamirostris TaxID=3113639 RepID=A0AAT9G815_9RICK